MVSLVDVSRLQVILKGPIDSQDKKKEFRALFTKLNELKTKEVEAFLKGMDVDLLENFFKVLKQEKLIFKEMHEQVIKRVVEAKYTIEVLENELMRVLNWPEKQHDIIERIKQKYASLSPAKRDKFRQAVSQKAEKFQKNFMDRHDKENEACWHAYRQLFYELDHFNHFEAQDRRKVG